MRRTITRQIVVKFDEATYQSWEKAAHAHGKTLYQFFTDLAEKQLFRLQEIQPIAVKLPVKSARRKHAKQDAPNQKVKAGPGSGLPPDLEG